MHRTPLAQFKYKILRQAILKKEYGIRDLKYICAKIEGRTFGDLKKLYNVLFRKCKCKQPDWVYAKNNKISMCSCCFGGGE